MAAALTLRSVKGSPLLNNEVDNNFISLNDFGNVVHGNVGIITNLTTQTKANLVNALNETQSNIGAISVLTTTTKANIVAAVNENRSLINTVNSNVGLLTNLTTQNKQNVIEAVNETRSNIGLISNLTTVTKANLVNAINEVKGNAIDASALTTGTLPAARLPTTGVSAATYGNATLIPSIVVDSTGRITSASNIALTSSGGGGSGLFNININNAVGYALTTSMANAYSAPTTTGQRYLVHSIHVTNIGTTLANVTVNHWRSEGANISWANTIPVPVGSAVELLKKPKILYPSDAIQMAEVAGDLHATIVLETSTDTKYFRNGVDVTSANTYIDLHIANTASVLESVLLSNDDGSTFDVTSRTVWTDGSNNIQGYLCYDLVIPNDATVELLEQPKYMPSGHKIRVQANYADRLEASITGRTVT